MDNVVSLPGGRRKQLPVKWEATLTYKKTKGPPQLLQRMSNVVAILRHDTGHGLDLREVVGGMGAVYNGEKELDPAVIPEFQSWLYIGPWKLDVSHELIQASIQMAARAKLVNPIKDYLTSLPEWDRQQRLPTWLQKYMGVEPNPVSDKIGAWWLQQAAGRGLEPGCQADYMLILEGEQGLGKSRALKMLTPEKGRKWFIDSVSQFREKDDKLQLAGRWIVELGELDALKSSSVDRVKTVITSPQDYVRPPYGKIHEWFPRTCVFAGTTNCQSYLRDTTGNRRFWPVKVTGRPDLDAIDRDRDQLWAEAVWREKQKITRWVTDKDEAAFTAEQDERRVELPWETEITRWLEDKDQCLTIDVFNLCLSLPPERRDNRAMQAVAEVMSAVGWEPHRTASARGYRRKQ